MKMTNLIAIMVAGACLTAIVYYLRPPQGDKIPISKESLDHHKRAEMRRGDVDIQCRQGDVE